MIGIVTGLAAEGRIAARLADARVVCAGGRSARAAVLARKLVAEGARALVSFGIAGGLAPDLAPGTLIVADRVVAPDGSGYAAALPWPAAGARRGTVAGVDAIVARAVDKAALHRATGALAADMESHAVAAVAAEHGLPFAVVRAIADPAARTLPPAARVPLRADGRPDISGVLAAVASNPFQIPALIRVARETARALKTLERALPERLTLE